MAGLATGTAIGAAFVLVAGFTTWAEAPTPAGRADTPLTNWRADRTLNLLRAITIGVTAGLIGGLAGGIAAAHNPPVPGLAIGLIYAVALGLPTGLAAGHHHAWMAYVIATNDVHAPALRHGTARRAPVLLSRPCSQLVVRR
jgi:hypothetical protein